MGVLASRIMCGVLSSAAMFSAHAAPVTGPAVNPLLTRAPDTLSTADVRGLQQRVADFGQTAHYRQANAALKPAVAPRVVFFGDSITQGWGEEGGAQFFPGKGYLNRGISGQTTAQMLVRFRQDVIALKPAVVVILAGTNDIAGNTGPAPLDMIAGQLSSMAELARAHGIEVVLSSVLPVSDYPWQSGVAPAPKVRALNDALKAYAAANGLVYLDYHTPMANAAGGLDRALAEDGVHPTAKGYAVMAPLAEQAIGQALAQRGKR